MTPRRRAALSGAEIGGSIVLYVFGMWVAGPRIVARPELGLAWWAFVLFAGWWLLWASPVRIHQDPPAVRGWGERGRKRTDTGRLSAAWPAYAAFTAAGALLLIAVALARDPSALARVSPETFAIRLFGYSLFGPVQALIFFSFLGTRLRDVLRIAFAVEGRSYWAASTVLTALLFSLAHFPNPALMPITLVVGIGWALLFQARANILLLGLSHALLGTMLHQVLAVYMRIGPFYAEPDQYLLRTVVPGLADLIGNRF